MKHLKMLAITLVAVAMTSAVAAQAASAGGKISTTEGYPVQLEGDQVTMLEHVFKFENDTLEVICPKASFRTGNIAAETETIAGMTAEYKGVGMNPCRAFGVPTTATIGMNNCSYTLHPGTQVTPEMEFHGTADIVCPAGTGPIVIVAATCEVQIGAQTGLGPVNYLTMTNTMAKRNDVTVNPAISKTIAYKETKDGIGCPLTQLNVAKTDGSYEGTTTVRGFDTTTGLEKEVAFK